MSHGTERRESDSLVKISVMGKDSVQTLGKIAATMKPEGVCFVHGSVKKCKYIH